MINKIEIEKKENQKEIINREENKIQWERENRTRTKRIEDNKKDRRRDSKKVNKKTEKERERQCERDKNTA